MQRKHRDRICASVCLCAEPGGFPGGSPAGRAVPDVERRLGRRRSCRGFISAAGRGGRTATGGAGDPPPLRPPAQPAPAPGAAAGGREGSGRRRERAERGRGRGAGGRLGMVLLPLWVVAAALLGARAAPGRQVSERRSAGTPALPFPPRCPTGSSLVPPLPRGLRAVPTGGEEKLRWTGGSPPSGVLQTAAWKQPGTGRGIPGPGSVLQRQPLGSFPLDPMPLGPLTVARASTKPAVS